MDGLDLAARPSLETVLAYVANPAVGSDPLGRSPYQLFPNRMPDTLGEELAQARRLGVSPVSPGTPAFDSMVNQGTVKWAVLENGELKAVPKFVDGQEISHAVISNGNPVRAAGEADIAGTQGGYFGLDINFHSGHFQPSEASLQLGKDAFGAFGILF